MFKRRLDQSETRMRQISLNLLTGFSFLIGTFNIYLPIEILKRSKKFWKISMAGKRRIPREVPCLFFSSEDVDGGRYKNEDIFH